MKAHGKDLFLSILTNIILQFNATTINFKCRLLVTNLTSIGKKWAMLLICIPPLYLVAGDLI